MIPVSKPPRPVRWRLGLLVLLVLAVAGLAVMALARWGEDAIGLLVRRDQTWQAMQSRGTWRVALDPSFPPFEMLDESGTPVGFDVDLARRMAADWGLELEVVAMGFDSLLDAVKAGKVDSVVSAMPYDPRATRDYAFPRPISNRASPWWRARIRRSKGCRTWQARPWPWSGEVWATWWGAASSAKRRPSP